MELENVGETNLDVEWDNRFFYFRENKADGSSFSYVVINLKLQTQKYFQNSI